MHQYHRSIRSQGVALAFASRVIAGSTSSRLRHPELSFTIVQVQLDEQCDAMLVTNELVAVSSDSVVYRQKYRSEAHGVYFCLYK